MIPLLTFLAQTEDAGSAEQSEVQPYSDMGGNLILPESASTFSGEVDWVFWFITLTAIFFAVAIVALMVFFVLRYRQKDKAHTPHGAHHNTVLELGWSILPGFFLIAFFLFGFRGYLNMATPPAGSYEIIAHAWKWGWEFEYPNGYRDVNLHLPGDEPVKLILKSQDVLHSLYIPAFRAKKDVVPGRFNTMWFESASGREHGLEQHSIEYKDQTYTFARNVYDLFCTEYCGDRHSQMNRKVYVYPRDEFDQWLEIASDWLSVTPPLATGQRVWAAKCKSCHSIDGTAGEGPTWKDLYGDPNHMMTTGPLGRPVDENYLMESTYYPQRQVVAGYRANGMAPWPLKDREMIGIIQFIKSVSKHYDGPPLNAAVETVEDWDTLEQNYTPLDD